MAIEICKTVAKTSLWAAAAIGGVLVFAVAVTALASFLFRGYGKTKGGKVTIKESRND